MIKQVYFSRSVKHFEQGFCQRWGVNSYHDSKSPALFVGAYNVDDVRVINDHSGLKVLWHPGSVKKVFPELDHKGLIIAVGRGVNFDVPSRYDVKRIDIEIKDFIQIKDFTPYKEPCPLGNKVYAYLGKEKDSSRMAMGYDTIKRLDDMLSFEFIYGYKGHTPEYARDNYYRQAFINIKPNVTGGMTTAIEMAYMGRKTVSNCPGPFILNYKSIDDICSIITRESVKIGQTPRPLISDDYFFNDWQDLKHWL